MNVSDERNELVDDWSESQAVSCRVLLYVCIVLPSALYVVVVLDCFCYVRVYGQLSFLIGSVWRCSIRFCGVA